MGKRIEYLDALRGFTMILVVAEHVTGSYQFGVDYSSISSFFRLFRMPLFFFLSGFILYKSTVLWNNDFCTTFLKKKFKVQIIPTVFFMSIFLYIKDISFFYAITDEFKSGYWFTITLFEYFFFFTLISFGILKFKLNKYSDICLIISSVFVFSIYYLQIKNAFGPTDITKMLGFVKFSYFPFFVFGVLIKKHIDLFFKIIENSLYMSIIILTFVFTTIVPFQNILNISYGCVNTIVSLVSTCLCIIIIFAFFKTHHSLFSKQTILGKALNYIGTRTLDVYLLHYFFLPSDLSVLKPLCYNNYTIEFFVTIFVSLIVIIYCLIISNCIRISPLLSHYLFGTKEKV